MRSRKLCPAKDSFLYITREVRAVSIPRVYASKVWCPEKYSSWLQYEHRVEACSRWSLRVSNFYSMRRLRLQYASATQERWRTWALRLRTHLVQESPVHRWVWLTTTLFSYRTHMAKPLQLSEETCTSLHDPQKLSPLHSCSFQFHRPLEHGICLIASRARSSVAGSSCTLVSGICSPTSTDAFLDLTLHASLSLLFKIYT